MASCCSCLLQLLSSRLKGSPQAHLSSCTSEAVVISRGYWRGRWQTLDDRYSLQTLPSIFRLLSAGRIKTPALLALPLSPWRISLPHIGKPFRVRCWKHERFHSC